MAQHPFKPRPHDTLTAFTGDAVQEFRSRPMDLRIAVRTLCELDILCEHIALSDPAVNTKDEVKAAKYRYTGGSGLGNGALGEGPLGSSSTISLTVVTETETFIALDLAEKVFSFLVKEMHRRKLFPAGLSDYIG